MSEPVFDSIDPHLIAETLRKARKASGLTQAEAAEIIGAARTTITAIEKGERRVRADELIALARAYGRQVSDLVRPRPEVESFRERCKTIKSGFGIDERVNKSIDAFEEHCRNYLELENLSGAPLPQVYPPPYDIGRIDPELAAEDVATAERNRLGLGEGPLSNLREILEGDVGLRIFFLPLQPAEFAAIYLFSGDLGGCIAVNARETDEHKSWTLAYLYGNFLSSRYHPAVSVENMYERLPPRERFADCFAQEFLMPASGLKRRFNSLRRANRVVTAADLGALAHYYGVTIADLTRRLEALHLLPHGVWDRMAEGGYKIREVPAEYRVEPSFARDDRLPIRYRFLAVSAFDRGLISEGQFAGFLGTDRLEARRIAEELRTHSSGSVDEKELELDLSRALIE